MQRNINSLLGFSLHATDGQVGQVEEFYFDDQSWTIRYFVVKTHGTILKRKVLISPESLIKFNWEDGTFPVNLTKKQIRNSPDIDTDKPVSRQHEEVLNAYYLWEPYWDNGFYSAVTSDEANKEFIQKEKLLRKNKNGDFFDVHLRSTNRVMGYSVQATDGEIGRVNDFILDTENWEITFLIASITGENGFRNVLISVKNIREMSYLDSKVYLHISMNSVNESDIPYDSGMTIPFNMFV